MKYKLIIVFLLAGCNNLFAQLGNETSNEEEKDQIARGDNAMNAQRESAWSLSSSNFDWKAPMQVNGRWEVVSLPSRNVSVSIPSTTTRKRRGYTQSQVKAYKKAKRAQEHNDWVDRRNAEIEAANEASRRRAEERKRRIEEENRRDRERGYIEYYARMSGYHQANAARDRWMATEGVRHLKEYYHAIDMAQIPQRQVTPKMEGMSGKELAGILKAQEENVSEGDLIVTFVDGNENRENKRNVTIQQDNKYIDLFDDGGYDQDEVSQWNTAVMSESPIVQSSVRHQIVQEYSGTLLIEKERLNLDRLNITTMPNMGCVALIGDSVLLLDNDSLPFLKWSVESNVSQVITCGERTFGKQDFSIVEINDDSLSVVCELESDDFCIYPETDSTFILCAKVLDLSIVTRINVSGLTYDELLRIPSYIHKIVSNGTVTLALLDNRIIDISKSPALFYHSKARINDICMCADGLLLATDEMVLLLKSPIETLTFTDEGATRLWCDGADVYLINRKGNLLRYSKNTDL